MGRAGAMINMMDSPTAASTSSSSTHWDCFGKKIPKQEVTYLSQIVLIYMVVITCIINLSLQNGDSNFWCSLLSSSVCMILPAPKIKKATK